MSTTLHYNSWMFFEPFNTWLPNPKREVILKGLHSDPLVRRQMQDNRAFASRWELVTRIRFLRVLINSYRGPNSPRGSSNPVPKSCGYSAAARVQFLWGRKHPRFHLMVGHTHFILSRVGSFSILQKKQPCAPKHFSCLSGIACSVSVAPARSWPQPWDPLVGKRLGSRAIAFQLFIATWSISDRKLFLLVDKKSSRSRCPCIGMFWIRLLWFWSYSVTAKNSWL